MRQALALAVESGRCGMRFGGSLSDSALSQCRRVPCNGAVFCQNALITRYLREASDVYALALPGDALRQNRR